MSINRGIDLQMVSAIKTHRDAGKASAAEELSKFLTRRRRWPFWIHIDHLTRAIDDHPELRHLMRAKQAVEMRATDEVDLAFIGHLHGDVGENAIAHRQVRHFAYAITFRRSGYSNDG